MTASIHYLPPGHGAARRAMQDPKTPAWIKDIAASMTGDTAPEDLIMAEPGTPKQIVAPVIPVVDYAPEPRPHEPLSWLEEFGDGVATACLFVALGALAGLTAAVWLVLPYIMAVSK